VQDVVRAVVVDDHPFFRDGIRRGLTQSGRITVVGDAGGGRDGLDLIRSESPHVAGVERTKIVEAALRVANGDSVVPPDLTVALADQIRLRAQPDQSVLSERERQVLDGFARGLSIPQLTAELFIGARTVKTHAQRLYDKLGVSDHAAAVEEEAMHLVLRAQETNDGPVPWFRR
jgi:two-component system nitrate/nitrite response regulator NarL